MRRGGCNGQAEELLAFYSAAEAACQSVYPPTELHAEPLGSLLLDPLSSGGIWGGGGTISGSEGPTVC